MKNFDINRILCFMAIIVPVSGSVPNLPYSLFRGLASYVQYPELLIIRSLKSDCRIDSIVREETTKRLESIDAIKTDQHPIMQVLCQNLKEFTVELDGGRNFTLLAHNGVVQKININSVFEFMSVFTKHIYDTLDSEYNTLSGSIDSLESKLDKNTDSQEFEEQQGILLGKIDQHQMVLQRLISNYKNEIDKIRSEGNIKIMLQGKRVTVYYPQVPTGRFNIHKFQRQMSELCGKWENVESELQNVWDQVRSEPNEYGGHSGNAIDDYHQIKNKLQAIKYFMQQVDKLLNFYEILLHHRSEKIMVLTSLALDESDELWDN